MEGVFSIGKEKRKKKKEKRKKKKEKRKRKWQHKGNKDKRCRSQIQWKFHTLRRNTLIECCF